MIKEFNLEDVKAETDDIKLSNVVPHINLALSWDLEQTAEEQKLLEYPHVIPS